MTRGAGVTLVGTIWDGYDDKEDITFEEMVSFTSRSGVNHGALTAYTAFLELPEIVQQLATDKSLPKLKHPLLSTEATELGGPSAFTCKAGHWQPRCSCEAE